MQCRWCQAQNREGAQFCRECGMRLDAICPACGAPVQPGSKFCDTCGATLLVPPTPPATLPGFASPGSYTPKHLAGQILTSRSALEGERKQVTVLFCDLAHSTALAERLGPEAMHTLLEQFFELALAEVHRYEGTINQFLGDGFMALFGAPLAHEDHAGRAVLAAFGIHRILRERRADFERLLGGELAVRMGVNTGLVVVGKIGDNLRMDYTAVGDTTNLAARLQELADPGTILLSEATAHLVKGYARVETLEPVHVKGKTEPIMVYKVVGVGSRRSPLEALEERGLGRFVGRERELAALHERLAQVERGEGQVVGIVGEPGIGKSRLLLEFRRTLGGRRVTYLEGRCLSFGRAIPYLPLTDIIRNNCGISETDNAKAMTEKVRSSLQEVGMDPKDGASYLVRVLGVREGTEGLEVLVPEAIKARTFETIRQLSLQTSQRQPLIVAVEDLHWTDKTSEQFLASLVESLAGARILLLTTYRPGYRPPWVAKPSAMEISLQGLTAADSLTVVRLIVPEERLIETPAQVILEKAEGNPLFLEELARAVLEHGGLHPSMTVPGTIQGVLMARIDRLPDEPKRLLQTASVLGREFSLGLLRATCEGPGGLEYYLSKLRPEFLHDQTRGGEPLYAFKHALVQEVAYGSLLTPRRQALHAAAGHALETFYADRLEEVYDRLAYHYSRTEEARKAVDYLTRFAEKVARAYAHVEAVAALEEALGHVNQLPAEKRDHQFLELVLRKAHSLYFLGRLRETLDLLLGQGERLARLSDPALAAAYHLQLGFTYNVLGDHERAAEYVQRALESAKRYGDRSTVGKAHYVLAIGRASRGQFREGVEYGRQAAADLDRTEERWWLGMAHWVVGLSSALLGDFDAALEAEARAYAIGEATGDPRLLSFATWTTGTVHATRGEWDAGIKACQRALEQSPDPVNSAYASAFLGYAYLERGDAGAAIPLLEQSVHQFVQFGLRQVQGWFTGILSEAYLSCGQLDKARILAIRGLEITQEVNYWFGVGWIRRTLGHIAKADGALSDAEARLTEALQSFVSVSAAFEVGRTHLALAEATAARGNREAATRHVTEALRQFGALRVPRYEERARQLAKGLDLVLSGESLCSDHPFGMTGKLRRVARDREA